MLNPVFGNIGKMKNITTYITEKFRVSADMKFSFCPKSYHELERIAQNKYNENPAYMDLSDVDVSNVDRLNWPKNIASVIGLFEGFDDIETINITGWKTGHIKLWGNLFMGCKKLKTIIGLEDLDTSSATQMSGMFGDCEKLTSLDISKWNLDNLEYANYMFGRCKNLKEIKGIEKIINDLKASPSTFIGCKKLFKNKK